MSESRVSAAEFEAIARERVPFAYAIGPQIESMEAGRMVVRVPFRDDFLRPGGTIAGPVLMALADLAVYGAVLSLVGAVELAVTTSLHINFLRRPAPADMVARAEILKLGRRLAVGEVRMYSDDTGELVAQATCTYSIPPER